MNRKLVIISVILVGLIFTPVSAAATTSWAEINGKFVIIDGLPKADSVQTHSPYTRARTHTTGISSSMKETEWKITSTPRIYRALDLDHDIEAAIIERTQAHNLIQLGFPAARARYGKGAGVVVAVIDTGVARLPEFGNRLLPGYNARLKRRQNGDANGHGTQVASIIGASANLFAGYVGVAPEVTILPVSVLSEHGEGSDADIARGDYL